MVLCSENLQQISFKGISRKQSTFKHTKMSNMEPP